MLQSYPGATPRGRSVFVGLLIAALIAGAAWLAVDMAKFAWWAKGYSERSRLGPAQITVPPSGNEAIVVLTGDHGRIPRALELLRSRGSRVLIISGIRKGITLTELVNQQGDATTNIHEIWDKIVVESQSSSTIENARETAKLLPHYAISRVVLVTSEYHMYRAAAIFRAIAPGYDYIEYAVPSEVSDLSFVPSARSLTALWKLWIEYWKLFLYRLTGTHPLIVHPKPA